MYILIILAFIHALQLKFPRLRNVRISFTPARPASPSDPALPLPSATAAATPPTDGQTQQPTSRVAALRKRNVRLCELPFNSANKFHAVVVAAGNERLLLLKGASEIVLSRCSRVVIGGREVAISAASGDSGAESDGFGDDSIDFSSATQPAAARASPSSPSPPPTASTMPVANTSRATILEAMQRLMSHGERYVDSAAWLALIAHGFFN